MKKSYFEIATTGEKKRYKTRLIIQTSAQFLVEYNQNYNYEIKLELWIFTDWTLENYIDIADIIGEDFYNFYF